MLCRVLGVSILMWSAFQQSAAGRCADPLVSPLYASSFLSSSKYNFFYSPSFARLHGSSGWSPSPRDRQPWLQIDLQGKYRITAIATQGTFNSYDWVTRYTLLYGDRPDSWTPYVQKGGNLTLSGNWNYYQVKRHVFHYAFTAKHLRFLPLAWSRETGGKIGVRLEVYGCAYDSHVMMFDGGDMVAYMFPGKSSHTLQDLITLNFKTLERDGVLLHSEGLQGDVLTLELKNARLYLHINLGSSTVHEVQGMTTLCAGSLLDDQHWHYVTVKRMGRQVSLTVDSHAESTICNGEFIRLDLDSQVYVGGVIEPDMPHLPDRNNFRGCLENVIYNGINIISQAQRKDKQIRFPQQEKTKRYTCMDLLLKPVTFTGPNSYLQVPGLYRKPRMSVKFKFRSWDNKGLLMFTSFSDFLGALELGLSDGQVNISLTQPEKKLQFAAGHGLNDGFWHTVEVVARDNFVTVTIDNDEGTPLKISGVFTVRTGDRYYFGGCPKTNISNTCETKMNTLHGCMQQIFIDTELVDIDALLRTHRGRSYELLLGTCGISDRCTPNPCEHNGLCVQSWDDFLCKCENTGYKGEVCHRSIYKESCEAYRLSGKSISGNYTIDPDLSGPLKPYIVNCEMEENIAWTIVGHDRLEDTRVIGSSVEQPFLGDVQYYHASWDEVSALASISEYCTQWIEYSCYMSRLLNSPNGRPYTYWLGRSDKSHYYWGGSEPGIQTCACGVNGSCTDPKLFCNCDADNLEWYSDKGWLDYRDHLPVRRIVIGDTNRTGSEANFSLGSLRCHGDGHTWNSVAFTKPTLIKFPPFKASSSADIRFYFKTSADHGVILENSDAHHRNFIRVELNCGSATTTILFIFMVGNGLQNVTMHSPALLNDEKWHFVQVEINVKLARLSVDHQPWVVRRFPGQSYITMKFTQPVLIGADKDILRAYLGCLRALRLNGVPLDLEKKANATEGIRQGCSGQCFKPSVPCRNSGRCVELYSSYSCDCSNTSFEGKYCHNDIGAYFGADMWLRYNILSTEVPGETHRFSYSYNTTGDEMEFSFSTFSKPAVLIYIGSSGTDYRAVILRTDGTLDLKYRIGITSYKYQLTPRNLADGFSHYVNITWHNFSIEAHVDYMEPTWVNISKENVGFHYPKFIFLGRVAEIEDVDDDIQGHNSPGFIGCLSGVRYNIYSPLKAYFRPIEPFPPISSQGSLAESNCGAYPPVLGPLPTEANPWDTGPVFLYIHKDMPSPSILAMIFLLLLVLIFVSLLGIYMYLYRYKGSYHTNEPKEPESPLNEPSLAQEPLAAVVEETGEE